MLPLLSYYTVYLHLRLEIEKEKWKITILIPLSSNFFFLIAIGYSNVL
jgi:hypothetical protein